MYRRSHSLSWTILYEYELGRWNEWHLMFSDSTSGWLSDASLEYAVRFSGPTAQCAAGPRSAAGMDPARRQREARGDSITARIMPGVEGELPFEYGVKQEVMFADMRSARRALRDARL